MQLLVGGHWQAPEIDAESLSSGEAVALICGFLQEHELLETLNAFISETGVDVSRTRLVEGLSLTRIIRECGRQGNDFIKPRWSRAAAGDFAHPEVHAGKVRLPAKKQML
eukprot:gene14362-20362_t